MRRCFLLLPLFGMTAVAAADDLSGAGLGPLGAASAPAAPYASPHLLAAAPYASPYQLAAADMPPPERDGILERTRRGVHSFTENVARTVDSWFGDKPFEEGGHVSGSIGFNFLARQDEGFRSNFRFRARLELPNVKEKGYLFFGQDNEREVVQDQPEAFTRQRQLLAESRRQDQSFFAGLGYTLRDYLDFRAGVRGGYKLYTQARYRQYWHLTGQDRVDFRETLFWTVDDGFGATTSLDYEHAYSPSLWFRWRNAGTVSQDTSGLDWSSSVGMFKALRDDRLVSLEALASGETGSRVGVAEYGVRAVWKQPIWRDWVRLELTVGHFWPQDEDEAERERSWAAGAGLEILF